MGRNCKPASQKKKKLDVFTQKNSQTRRTRTGEGGDETPYKERLMLVTTMRRKKSTEKRDSESHPFLTNREKLFHNTCCTLEEGRGEGKSTLPGGEARKNRVKGGKNPADHPLLLPHPEKKKRIIIKRYRGGGPGSGRGEGKKGGR